VEAAGDPRGLVPGGLTARRRHEQQELTLQGFSYFLPPRFFLEL